MTYHIKTNDGTRLRLSLDPKQQFPEKVYAVANDGFLIQWNNSGTGVILCQETQFEKNVMKCYPGFVKIPNYANIRRLFREYGFDWTLGEDETLEFHHPFLIRGKPELLSQVKTRRKSLSSPWLRRSRVHFPGRPRKIFKAERRMRKRTRCIPEETESNEDCVPSSSESSLKTDDSKLEMKKENPDLDSVLTVYAKNEMTEDELVDLIYQKSCQLKYSSKSSPKSGYEWLYSYPLIDNSEDVNDFFPQNDQQQPYYADYTDSMGFDYAPSGVPSSQSGSQENVYMTPYINDVNVVSSEVSEHEPSFLDCQDESTKVYEELKPIQPGCNPELKNNTSDDTLINADMDSPPQSSTSENAVFCCDCHCHKIAILTDM